jgi:putative aminopeptidase FrvX
MDMLLAADTIDLKGCMQSYLGKGPAASCFNFSLDNNVGCIAHEGLYGIAEESALSCGIPLQRYVSGGCGDNAYAMFQEDGPAVIEIGAPVRYAHSSCEVADLSDIKNTSIVITEMIHRIKESFRQNRY